MSGTGTGPERVDPTPDLPTGQDPARTFLRHDAAPDEATCPWCELAGDENAHTAGESFGDALAAMLARVSVAEVGEDEGVPVLWCWCGHALHLPACAAGRDSLAPCLCAVTVAVAVLIERLEADPALSSVTLR